MSIGVQGSINSAELARIVNTDVSKGGGSVHDSKKAPNQADAALVAIVGGHELRRHGATVAGEKIQLTPPKVSTRSRDVGALTVNGMVKQQDRLTTTQDPRVSGMHGALAQQHAAMGTAAGASSGFSFATDAAFDAMLALDMAEQKDVQADVAMQGKLVTLAHDAMLSAAQEDRNIGDAQMTAAIAGGALQAATALGGAYQQMKGLNTKSMSIENELKPQAELKQFHSEQSFELRGLNKPVLANEEMSSVQVKGESGETRRFDIDEGGEQLSTEHQNVLAQDGPARQHRIEMHGIRHEQNGINATRRQVKGDLINAGGQVGKNAIEGASAEQQGADRAEQKEDESAQQTAMATANAREEAAHRGREAVQKAIEAAKNQVNNNNAVASQVAGNLRA
ncbi:IpaC/SipC family type III secretion system effector [Burkholderia ubonensis]|uniref:IpaC/SipC family type III secretion system effector n=1 Tax=Burkholderia ubonensis TaxID=101571 RepID=UPI0007565AB7|nr:IpaC/SipC family type III secretion system effector [Burkholderia ubonensis]KWK77682.1 restriction endonuclease [Burkholderia ubonensis]